MISEDGQRHAARREHGAYNRRRLLTRLSTLAAGGLEPGLTATLLRRSVALEVGFALVVLAVTSVLVVTEPATGT